MIVIPPKDKSSDKKLNDDEFAEAMDHIIDETYGIKIITIASNAGPYI